MKQTSNYQLPQWEETDRVMMKDFNDMTEKIDAAIPQLDTGTYTGDGEASRTIQLGFTPKAVFLCTNNSLTRVTGGSAGYYGGLALPGEPSTAFDYDYITIVEGGFQVIYLSNPHSNSAVPLTFGTNVDQYRNHYIAVK